MLALARAANEIELAWPGSTLHDAGMSRKRSAIVISTQASRFTLARHLAVFQLKLAIDGLKDLVLAPVSLAAGVLGILLGPSERMGPLRQVLRMGRAFDDYVDLYGSIETLKGEVAKSDQLARAAEPVGEELSAGHRKPS